MKIKVVGPGCKNCQTLYDLTQDVVKDLPGTYEVEHISDIATMISYGVSKSPGLIINGCVVSQGKRLKEDDVRKLIENAQSA